MSSGICRIGDSCTGTCTAHRYPRSFTGTWTTGSTSVKIGGVGVVRVGDTGVTDCGHHIVAVGGSSGIIANGIGLHRIGDSVLVLEGGSGVTTSGSNVAFA